MGIIRTMLTDGQRGLGANWVLSVAKIAAPEKVPVRVADAATELCRVYAPLCATDDLSVPEVVLEGIVVREEQSGTADCGQRDNVFVVGTADALGSKCLSL